MYNPNNVEEKTVSFEMGPTRAFGNTFTNEKDSSVTQVAQARIVEQAVREYLVKKEKERQEELDNRWLSEKARGYKSHNAPLRVS